MKIVADIDIPYLKGILEPYAEVVYLPGRTIGAGNVRDADALITRTRTRCDAALLEGSRVGIVATATIGYDHIDMDYCASRGIQIATSAGCNARAVLQWVAAVLREAWLAGVFASPAGTAIGVVGVGNVGSLVARYAALWGFRVLCCDPPREASPVNGLYAPDRWVTLNEIASEADIITFHTPLTRSGPHPTMHLADDRFFARTRPGALIVNSSRGGVVDEKALLSSANRCAIDVWENEPDINPVLAARALAATPHIAGYSAQGKAMATAMAVGALARHFGWPLEGWYPTQGEKTAAHDISWEQMCRLMPSHFDIATQSVALKADIAGFEKMRDNYAYRSEFF